MNNKNDIYRKEFANFMNCITENSWYSIEISEVLKKSYNESTQWDDTLDFMDSLVEMFEDKSFEKLVIIQAHFTLPDVRGLNTTLPKLEDAKKLATGCICAFPHRIATLVERSEMYQSPLWNNNPRYHSMKLFTYYRSTRYPDDDFEVEENPGRYRRDIVRFYSQKWSFGNSPGFLVP